MLFDLVLLRLGMLFKDMNRALFILLIWTLSLVSVRAIECYSFKHINMEMGLSNNQVNSIYRDNYGFVWFATSWGLDRYDGYNIKVFLRTEEAASLMDNYVLMVKDITDTKMLVRTLSCFVVLDKETERFCSLRDYLTSEFSGRADAPALNELDWVDKITNAFVDKYGNIWMINWNKCRIFSSAKKQFICDSEDGLEYNGVCEIIGLAESNGNVNLVFADGKIAQIAMVNGEPAEKIRKMDVPAGGGRNKLFVDSAGDYWVINDNGYELDFFDHVSGRWYRCSAGDRDSYFPVPDYVMNCVAEDKDGRIWVSSDHGGIHVINKSSHGVSRIMSNSSDKRSLPNNSIQCIYHDGFGGMWISEVRAGVSLYNESIFKFNIDNLDLSALKTDFVAQINSIEEDLNGNMWYATNGSGLVWINEQTGQKKIYCHSDSDLNSIKNDILVDVLADKDGNIWTGSYLGGLSMFDGHKFVSYLNDRRYTDATACENVWSVAQDTYGNIWVGTLGHGVAVRNRETKVWTDYNKENSALISNFVLQLCGRNDGNMLVATAEGLMEFDKSSEVFKPVMTADTKKYLNESVHDVYIDSRGLIWVGTINGLTVLDGSTYSLKGHFDIHNGILNNVITGIVEDADKNMWVTTTFGITNIMVNSNPRTGDFTYTIYNYNEQDGFLGGSVNVRSIKRTSHGDIIVGGNPGIIRFNPEAIKYNHDTPVVRFTGLSVLGSDVKTGEEQNERIILTKAMPYLDELVLNYSDNMFTVSFSMLSYVLPEKVSYSYMLEGFNDKWLPVVGHSVSYTNLAPGHYMLKVRASNCDGFSSDDFSELAITILPPWWKTTWAYIFYITILVLLVLVIMRQITYRERYRFNLHKIEIEVQQRHEVEEMKMQFFTNVSHELRTPLSLIITPLENLISSTDDKKLGDKLELIHRNALRLLNMVNQLLDFRKIDVNAMKLNLSRGEIVSFVRQCNDSFVALSERKVTFGFSSNRESVYMDFDNDKMGKIVNNLLSNAFKFTPDGGKIMTSVNVDDENSNVVITVADTGLGISDENKKHVFEKFYQVPQSDTSYSGSGIGLFLVSDFVKMHNGQVTISDNVGGGTVFSVVIPLHVVDTSDVQDNDLSEVEDVADENNCRQKIIIVDDNADFRTLLTDTLSDSFEILSANNGAEALDLIVKTLPDLVITDVMMPVMDGNELCRRVKNDVRISHIPLIMLTAKSADEQKIVGLTNGADEYLAKPFNSQILRLKVARLIELSRQRHDKFTRQIEPEPSEITITSLDEQLIKKAIKYVEDNISDSNLSVEEMSRYLGMSRVHLYKKMTSITGRSPIEFIRVIRLKRAAQLLRDKQQNVSDVAYSVGFNSPKYFSKYFKDEFGVLPSVYQNNQDGLSNTVDIGELK